MLGELSRIFRLVALALLLPGLAGCYYDSFTKRRVIVRDGEVTARDVERYGRRLNQDMVQLLCDSERERSKSLFLKQYGVHELREIALKVSRELSKEDVEDLKRLTLARQNGHYLSSEQQRRTSELISEIYVGAIARAGLSLGATERLNIDADRNAVRSFSDDRGASLVEAPGESHLEARIERSYVVDVSQAFFTTEAYQDIVASHPKEDILAVGTIGRVVLGASPDQSRYRVTFERLYRLENAREGEPPRALYESLSLSQYVEGTLPEYCSRTRSLIDHEAFDTISGLSEAAELN